MSAKITRRELKQLRVTRNRVESELARACYALEAIGARKPRAGVSSDGKMATIIWRDAHGYPDNVRFFGSTRELYEQARVFRRAIELAPEIDPQY